ncbi:DNA-binding response regulator [Luedemannella helvata]|uniref:Response regulator transcription factor n=1 Tax=Luedemannella helvata TaxID=349315 RepID=A0ABP4VRB0_9ACTN
MRSVLVCVRTTVAAQTIANCATRLGLGAAIRTALSGPEALARLAEQPADIVFADTALTRPDTVGFTRLVRERSPGAIVVLIGPEEPAVAQAAVAAGARGFVRGERDDLITSVTKGFMLLVQPSRANVPQQRFDGPGAAPAAGGPAPAGAGQPGRAGNVGPGGAGAGPGGGTIPGGGNRPGGGTIPGVPPAAGAGNAVGPGYQAGGPGAPNQGPAFGPGAAGGAAGTGNAGPQRRLALTERELQVLRRMADGKSNAEIGRELYVSEDTVKTHARRLFRKLGARDRAHAVAAAFRAGMVT